MAGSRRSGPPLPPPPPSSSSMAKSAPRVRLSRALWNQPAAPGKVATAPAHRRAPREAAGGGALHNVAAGRAAHVRGLLRGARGRAFSLPHLFIGGRLVGGADEVRQLHETGQLRRLLDGAAGQDPAFVCDACGGVRFVPCPACGGSRKVFVEEEDRVHRCGDCNENGLVRCRNCCT